MKTHKNEGNQKPRFEYFYEFINDAIGALDNISVISIPDTGIMALFRELKKRKIPPKVKRVVSVILDKKAEKTIVIKLKGISEITDFIVICNGNSSRQNKAISDEIQEKLKKEYNIKAFSIEGENSTGWILLDYIDFVIHIFSPEIRKKFSLEKLWMDGKRYNFYRDKKFKR